MSTKNIDPFILAQKIRDRMTELGIPFFDGLDAFKQTPSQDSLYFPVDGHLAPSGNQYLGDFLANQILKEDKLRRIFNSN